jgi:hypothetical protein
MHTYIQYRSYGMTHLHSYEKNIIYRFLPAKKYHILNWLDKVCISDSDVFVRYTLLVLVLVIFTF